ncbi:hypothetical protein LTR28_013318, partial [Elasticomyces elasticus]
IEQFVLVKQHVPPSDSFYKNPAQHASQQLTSLLHRTSGPRRWKSCPQNRLSTAQPTTTRSSLAKGKEKSVKAGKFATTRRPTPSIALTRPRSPSASEQRRAALTPSQPLFSDPSAGAFSHTGLGRHEAMLSITSVYDGNRTSEERSEASSTNVAFERWSTRITPTPSFSPSSFTPRETQQCSPQPLVPSNSRTKQSSAGPPSPSNTHSRTPLHPLPHPSAPAIRPDSTHDLAAHPAVTRAPTRSGPSRPRARSADRRRRSRSDRSNVSARQAHHPIFARSAVTG